MNRNTIVRIEIPMALYESVKGKVLDEAKEIKEGVSIEDILNGKAKAGNKSTDFKPNMLVTPSKHYGDKAELKQRSGRVTKIEPEYIYYTTEDGGKYKNSPSDLYIINGNLDEAKVKPSKGLTVKEKTAVVKKAKAGQDIGKKGKGFEKVAKKAAKEYGSEEAGKKVAGAQMWKAQAKKAK